MITDIYSHCEIFRHPLWGYIIKVFLILNIRQEFHVKYMDKLTMYFSTKFRIYSANTFYWWSVWILNINSILLPCFSLTFSKASLWFISLTTQISKHYCGADSTDYIAAMLVLFILGNFFIYFWFIYWCFRESIRTKFISWTNYGVSLKWVKNFGLCPCELTKYDRINRWFIYSASGPQQ